MAVKCFTVSLPPRSICFFFEKERVMTNKVVSTIWCNMLFHWKILKSSFLSTSSDVIASFQAKKKLYLNSWLLLPPIFVLTEKEYSSGRKEAHGLCDMASLDQDIHKIQAGRIVRRYNKTLEKGLIIVPRE
jgi:hypothetical protein